MATAAAAVVARSRRDVVSHFMLADAVRPADAVSYAPTKFIDRRMFERFKRAGLVKPGEGDDRWYLDIPAYHANRVQRLRLVAVVLEVVCAALLLSLLAVR